MLFNYKQIILQTLLGLTLVFGMASVAQAQERVSTGVQEQNIDTYIGLLRADVNAQKVAVIGQIMQFTPAGAAKFWPLYEAYSNELASLGDERVALIKDYADNYGALSDSKADEIVYRALELEGKRTVLKRKHYDLIKVAMGSTAAAKFLQVENQLLMLVDLQVASSLPIVE